MAVRWRSKTVGVALSAAVIANVWTFSIAEGRTVSPGPVGHYGHLHEVPPARRGVDAARESSSIARGAIPTRRSQGAGQNTIPATTFTSLTKVRAPMAGQTQPVIGGPLSPMAQVSFEGGGYADPHPPDPADPAVAVSNSDVVEETNNKGYVFDKSGALVSTFDLSSFFGLPGSTSPVYQYAIDPQIVWDSDSDRWFSTVSYCQIEEPDNVCTPGTVAGGGVLIAVSKSDDPSPNNWVVYTVDEPPVGYTDEQARLGFSADKVVVAWDRYSSGGFDADYMAVIQETDLVALDSIPNEVTFNMTSGLNHRFGIVPAVPTPSDQTNPVAYAAYHGSDLLGQYASTLTITGTPDTKDVTYVEAGPSITSMSTPPAAPQFGSTSTISTGTTRFLTVTETGGDLWIGADDACIPAGDTIARACGRIIEVKLTPKPKVIEDVDLGEAGAYIYDVAPLATDCSRRLFVTYTVSSATAYPTAEVATSPIPLSSTFSAVNYGTGTTTYRGPAGEPSPSLWGQYSAISSDGSDYCSHGPWVAAEYGGTSSTTSPNWGTAVAQFTLDAPIVTSVSPSEGAAGTKVAIYGTSFLPGSQVFFGAVASTSVTFVDGDQLTAAAPFQLPGTVPIRVVTPLGTSTSTAEDLYTYPQVGYVAAIGGISEFDTTTQTLLSTVIAAGGSTNREIAVTSDGTTGYMTSASGVIPLNLLLKTAGHPISTGKGASGIALAAGDHYALVANTTASTISRINLEVTPPKVSKPLPVPTGPNQVVVTPHGSTAFVTDMGGQAVTVINVTSFTIRAVVPLPTVPWGETMSPDGDTLWVTSPSTASHGAELYEISSSTYSVESSLSLGNFDTRGIAETPNEAELFIADDAQSMVTEVDTSGPTVGPSVPSFKSGPIELAIAADGTTAFVTDSDALDVTPIGTAGPSPEPPIESFSMIGPYGIALSQPPVRSCEHGPVSSLDLGFVPPSAEPGGLITEVGDFTVCDSPPQISVVTNTTAPGGCPAVKSFKITLTTPPIGKTPIIHGFTAPACAGTYTVKVTLKVPTQTLTSSTATYQVT